MIPPFAPFPPAHVLEDLAPDDWDSCLECWILLVQRSLRLSSKEFSVRVQKDRSMTEFIVSYMNESARPNGQFKTGVEKEKCLRRELFLLTHRILTEVVPVPQELLQITFLGDLSIVYGRHRTLKSMLEPVWDREKLEEKSFLHDHKHSLMNLLDSRPDESPSEFDRAFLRTVALLKVSYQYGQFLMLGSDFLDLLPTALENSSASHQPKIVAIGYLSLISLLEIRRPKFSALLDHLYSLESAPQSKVLLQKIVSSTPLLRRLRENLLGQNIDRAQPLIQELEAFEQTKSGQSRSQVSRKSDKGKENADQTPLHDMHVHQMSLVTQVQDLFPDLGSAFVVKLLEEYEDDPEQVVSHLLEDSLPTHLKQLDRSEAL